MISSRLKQFISENNILTPSQHGFRHGHSTITSVTTLLDDVYIHVNLHKDTFLIYLDLKKAFDTVSLPILINKLEMFGLDLSAINWFKSYLVNRQQYVKFNNIESTCLDISFGVLQGSILGPTLVALYINDLADMFNDENVTLYADDTVIYNSDHLTLQNMLDMTNSWCEQNLLTVNCKKSQWMRTSIVQKIQVNRSFTLGLNPLDWVKEYRYLLDSDLNFDSQCENLCRRVNYKLGFFRKIRSYLDIDTAITIYKSTILPIIEYADLYMT